MFSQPCSPWPSSRRQPPARITTIIITITTDEIGPLTGAFFLSAPGRSTDPRVVRGSRSRSSDGRSLERLAEKFRSLQAVSPRQIRGLGDADADAGGNVRFADARMQRERRLVE